MKGFLNSPLTFILVLGGLHLWKWMTISIGGRELWSVHSNVGIYVAAGLVGVWVVYKWLIERLGKHD